MGGTGIRLLGRLAIEREHEQPMATFPGRRSELVFAYLAAEHRRDVTRDELADALWPQELPDAWAAALRGVVSDVRRVIEASGLDAGDLLGHTGGGYRLRLPPDTVVDLDEARAAVAAARAQAQDDAAGAATQAGRAADLARQPFLPRHEGSWVDGIRRELAGILVEALELAAASHLRAGDTRSAAAAAARLIEVEPYNDAAHRLRIEVLGAGGDRAGAQRAYDECRATFADDLGVEPSAETQAALQRALEALPERPAGGRFSRSASSPLAGVSVLVVDDHDFQRRTALALLGRLGVGRLSEAADGVEALEVLAASEPPDVIVCDIDMPGMDGVEFIRHVAERRLASAVLIASGLDRSVLHAVEAVGEGYGLQVLGAVQKPLTARGLAEMLAAYRRPTPQSSAWTFATDADLRAALDQGRIGTYFVPIVDLHDGVVGGARAVPTWEDDAGVPQSVLAGHVSREAAARLADRVLDAACGQVPQLTGAGLDLELWVAAADALADIGSADRLLGIVRGQEADPRRIVCTVSERAVRRSSPAELEILTRLRVKGFGICLDDFGGTHAGDDALERVPLTAVALSPALVSGAAGDPARAAALEQSLDRLRERGLPAVACGCDTAADYELLVQAGCRYVQGDFIGTAMAGGDLGGWALGWQAPALAEDPP